MATGFEPVIDMPVTGLPIPSLVGMVYSGRDRHEDAELASDTVTLIRVAPQYDPYQHRNHPGLWVRGDWDYYPGSWFSNAALQTTDDLQAVVSSEATTFRQVVPSKHQLGDLCRVGEPHVIDGDVLRYTDGSYIPIPEPLLPLYPPDRAGGAFRKSRDLPPFATRMVLNIVAVKVKFLWDVTAMEWFWLYRGNADAHLLPVLWHANNYNFDWGKNWLVWIYRTKVVHYNPQVVMPGKK